MTRIRTVLALASAAFAGAVLAAPVATGAVALTPIGTFQRPVFVIAPPGDVERVFVVERGGTVRVLVNGVLRPAPYLDIRSKVQTSDGPGEEQGLLSMAFAPDFATSRRVYVYYTVPPASGTVGNDLVIEEYQAESAAAAAIDPATARPILRVPHRENTNHNGGQLAFGPDGLLWIGTGDGGGAGDPDGNGQDRETLLGKILRVDVRPGAPLTPSDNPFTSPNGDPLVWSYGLRNPWRFSFDRATGDLAIGDVGQGFAEEINYVTKAAGLAKGGNYGWNTFEGLYTYPGNQPVTPSQNPNFVFPVINQLHAPPANWCSITGGYVVRDPELPDLLGRYVYGDYCKGEIWSASLSATGATGNAPTGLSVPEMSSFGEDGCGRVYVASIGGAVSRLSATGRCAGPAPTPFPSTPVTPSDTTSPGVRATANARQKVGRRQIVRVRVTCNEQCVMRATGRLTIRNGRRVSAVFLVPVTRTLGANRPTVLTLSIPKRSRAAVLGALGRGRSVSATITLLARDASQNRTVRRKTIRLALR
jgi:glucose/arabinose dehydrogenase